MEDSIKGNLDMSDCVDNDINPDQSNSKSKTINDVLIYFELSIYM